MSLELLISNFSYLAIFILMVTNGLVNFPSSQILYVVCGYFVGTGNLLFVPTIIAGALGNTLGNILTFLLIKKYGTSLAHKLLVMDKEMFDRIYRTLHETFSKKGMWWIFFGKMIPSIKSFIPIVAGLAKTKTTTTSFIFLVASSIWATAVTSLGYFFGKNASLSSLSGVSLIIGAVVVFYFYKKLSQPISKESLV